MKNDEGYIKFDLYWTKAPAINPVIITEINSCRTELFNLGLIGRNDDGTGFGNISVRISANQFLISGSRTGGIPILGPGHYTVVEKYDIAGNKVWCKGPIEASSESLSHAAIYHYSQSNAVIHVHNMDLWENYLHKLPTTDESARYGTPAMAYEIKRILSASKNQPSNVIIMGGHESGILVYGHSITETFRIVKDLLN